MFYEDDDMFEDQDFDKAPESVNQALQAWQQMMMRRLVEENFEKIKTQGFSAQQMEMWDDEQIETLIETFDFMISEFEQDEEYEKCSILVNAKRALIERRGFAPIQNI